MNKRKTTSIALAAAVAISTVQLAYPANVFAQEQININRSQGEQVGKIGFCGGDSSYNSKTYSFTNGKGELIDYTYYNNITWEIEENGTASDNKKTYTLKIYGNGDMADFGGSWSYGGKPWLEGIKEDNGVEITKARNYITKIEIEGNINNIGSSTFEALENVESVTIPEGVKIIGKKAFNSCKKLKIVNLNSDLEVLGEISFSDCKALENITFPKNLKKISDSAFSGCSALNCDIVIPDSVETIGNSAFANCTGLKEKTLVLGKSVRSIGDLAFGSLKLSGKLIIPDSVETVGSSAFTNNKFNEVHLGSLLKEIGDNAFSGLDLGEKSLIIPDSVETIGNNAFSAVMCKIIKLGSSVKTIGESAFINCTQTKIVDLTSLSDGVEYGSENVFHSLSDNNIIYVNSEKQKNEVNGIITPGRTAMAITNGGTFEKNTVFEEGKLAIPEPEKNNAMFVGWYDNKDFTGEIVTNPTKGNTYYAKWSDLKDINLVHDGDGDEKTNAETTISLGTATRVESSNESIVKVDGITIKAVGTGTAIIQYIDANNNVIGQQKVKVTKPNETIATIGNIPYIDLQSAITNAKEGDTIVLEEGKDTINISKTLEINNKNNITIDFKGRTLASNSTSTDKKNFLIKITDSTGITIKNANFDLSNGEEVAILVDGSNKNSNVTLSGKVNATRGTEKAPVVKMVGDKSEVNIEEGAKLNDDLTPSIGKEDDASIILGKDSLASNIHNKNNSSGGGNYYPSKPSKPTYTHEKIEGLDRYETAAKIADKLGSYDTAVLVNATSTMSDGLSAAGLAGKEDAAILLVKKDSIPKATMDRLKKVEKVYIIGGENAISKKVSDEIAKNVAKVEVERLGGKTRVETSELVAKEIGNYSNAFIVNGFKGEADAMSASSVVARYEAPILLTNGKTSIHAKKSGVEYYVVGGTSVVNKSIADKYNAKVLAGKDRYATNREVIDEFYSGSDKLYIANGDKLVDALTASPLAKNYGIVLVNKKSDRSILKDKNTVQVGGMDFEIEFEK